MIGFQVRYRGRRWQHYVDPAHPEHDIQIRRAIRAPVRQEYFDRWPGTRQPPERVQVLFDPDSAEELARQPWMQDIVRRWPPDRLIVLASGAWVIDWLFWAEVRVGVKLIDLDHCDHDRDDDHHRVGGSTPL